MSNTLIHTNPNQRPVWQIRVKGHLGTQLTDWLGGLAISKEHNGETVFTGRVVDQATLYGLLKKMRQLGMTLLSINTL